MSIFSDQVEITSSSDRSGINVRFYLCRLVDWEVAVPKAERVVVNPDDNIYGTFVGLCRRQNGTDGEVFTNGVLIFAVHLVLED